MKDIYLDRGFDLSFSNGDFSVEDDLNQRIMCICSAHRGHYKQWPLLGAGIQNQLNGPINLATQILKIQLESDGLIVKRIVVNNPNLIIDAAKTT